MRAEILSRLVRRDRAAVVLMYHSIAEPGFDPWRLAVSPARFDEQLSVIAQRFRPLGLRELVAGLGKRPLPRRGVVVTFDDGYRDNLLTARPLLEKHGVPATIFVVTGFLGMERALWWEELAALCRADPGLPLSGSVEGGGSHLDWSVDGGHAEEAPVAVRERLFMTLWDRLRRLPPGLCLTLLDELGREAGDGSFGSPDALTEQDVVSLAASDGVEIGGHSRTHPALGELPLQAQLEEIEGSRDTLQQLLGEPVESFSYPYGNFTAETVECVRNAGFACSATTVPERVGARADAFELPRVQVEDWAGSEFERRLEDLFAQVPA